MEKVRRSGGKRGWREERWREEGVEGGGGGGRRGLRYCRRGGKRGERWREEGA